MGDLEQLATLSDEAVVARIRAGDAALFEILMRRHNARIFRAVRAIVKTADEAEDVMQEASTRSPTSAASRVARPCPRG
jgi:RNA polymerase sigma-70 factor (ECF subfamily)